MEEEEKNNNNKDDKAYLSLVPYYGILSRIREYR